MCAQHIRQAVPDGGEIIISVGSLDKENGHRRRQGVIDELLERSFEPQRPADAVDAPLKGPKYTNTCRTGDPKAYDRRLPPIPAAAYHRMIAEVRNCANGWHGPG